MKRGRLLKHRGLLSASSSNTSSFPGNVRIVIQSRSGKEVEELSRFREEREVLFPTDARYRILEVREGMDGKTEVNVEEVADKKADDRSTLEKLRQAADEAARAEAEWIAQGRPETPWHSRHWQDKFKLS